jgi:hypothetical protein
MAEQFTHWCLGVRKLVAAQRVQEVESGHCRQLGRAVRQEEQAEPLWKYSGRHIWQESLPPPSVAPSELKLHWPQWGISLLQLRQVDELWFR